MVNTYFYVLKVDDGFSLEPMKSAMAGVKGCTL